jgi:hypothetical protein
MLLGAASVFAEFGTNVQPVLAKYCVSCHGSQKPAGKVALDKLTGNLTAHPAEVDVWSAVLEQIETGNMPPKSKARPSAQELATLKQWIQANLGAAQNTLARKLLRPENGNYISHEKLFDPKTAAAGPKIAGSPARVWRTLPQAYEGKQRWWLRAMSPAKVNGREELPAPFGLIPEHQLKNYSYLYTLEASQTEGLANNARALLIRMIDGDPKNDRVLMRKLALAKEPPSDADLDKVIVELYKHWIGRSPESEELSRRRAFVVDKIKKFGNRDGLIYGLVPVLAHPEVFFHAELAASENNEPTLLAPRELADALGRAVSDNLGKGNPFTALAERGTLGDGASFSGRVFRVHAFVARLQMPGRREERAKAQRSSVQGL